MVVLRLSLERARWVIIAAATLSMMIIGLYQYSWTLFVKPIGLELEATAAAVQLTFTIFTTLATFVQPIAGVYADRRGPFALNLLGGIISGIGWVTSSYASSSSLLYITYGIGSIGVGIIYATAVGTANKWFPERRGLATGLVTFGYGFGAAVLNPIISWIISLLGYRTAFLYMGSTMLLALTILALLSRYPQPEWAPSTSAKIVETTSSNLSYQYKPLEMIKTSTWWLTYAAFVLTSQTGLLITSQLTSIGDSFRLSQSTVLLATVVFPIANGFGRIVGGQVSDRLGREFTMTVFFLVQGVLSLILLSFGTTDMVFLATVSLTGFFWGPIFTFFPSLIGDYYGRKYSTANIGVTYTAKAWGGWIGGYIAALLSSLYGFGPSIILSALFCFTAAVMVFPKILRRPVIRN